MLLVNWHIKIKRRTNHGIEHTEQGYQRGADKLSSELRFFNARSFPEAGIFLASPGLGSLNPPQEDKISKTKNAGMIFFKTLSKFGIFFINA